MKKKHRHAVQYVGNPLVEVVDAALAEKEDFIGENNLDDKRPIVALLFGSRKQEILKNDARISGRCYTLSQVSICRSRRTWLRFVLV